MTEARGRRIAGALKCLGSGKQLALGAPECLTRLFDLFIAIIDQGQQLLRAITHGKNIVHGGTPLTQQALEVGIPLTHASELARVEGDAIAIGTKLVRAILKRDTGIRKRIGNVAQFAIDGSHTGKLCHGAVHGIERSPFGGKRCMGIVSRGNQYLGMFGARQQFLEFLILARLGVDLGDTLEGKTRFLDATPLRTRGLLDATDLLGSRARGFKADAVHIQRLKRRAPRPGIDHRNVMRRIEQALVLVLAAQIHHHANALRKLAHAGDAAVNFYAAAALGRKATLYGEPLRVVRTVEQACLDARLRLALAHRRRIRALAQYELKRREQRGLAGTGLAGQDSQAGTRHQRRLTNECDVRNLKLIDHDALRRTRGSPSYRSSRGRNPAAAHRRDRDARPRSRRCRRR